MGANSFLYEMTSIYMGCNNENDRVASPENVPIHLKAGPYFFTCGLGHMTDISLKDVFM